MIDISAVVPVYNTQPDTLRRCFRSIINQKGVSIEIIAVDDGSKSQTAATLDSIAEEYCNMSSLHIDNCGAANARNVGISHATGQYIVFVDADDYIPNDQVFATMFQYAKQNQLDLVFGCNNRLAATPIERKTARQVQLAIIQQTVVNQAIEVGSPWAKLFRRQFIVDNHIQFDPRLRRSHDRMFMLSILETAPMFDFVNHECYHFCIDDGESLSRSFNLKTKEFLCNYLHACEEFVEQHHQDDTEYRRALCELRVTLYRQYAAQGSFHPSNNASLRERCRDFRMAKNDIIGKSRVYVITYKGVAMRIFSLLLAMRLYPLLDICLEIHRRRLKAR